MRKKARNRNVELFVPFPQCPYTDEAFVHWLVLHDYFFFNLDRRPFSDYDAGIRTDYMNGLQLLHQIGLLAEAMVIQELLFSEHGQHAIRIAQIGRFRDRDNSVYYFHNFFSRSRDQLLHLSRKLGIPITRTDLRAQEWFWVGRYATDRGMGVPDFLRCVQQFGVDAIRRVALYEACTRYAIITREEAA